MVNPILTLSTLYTNTNTCANSVDSDEAAPIEPSHQDLHLAILIVSLTKTPYYATLDMSRW